LPMLTQVHIVHANAASDWRFISCCTRRRMQPSHRSRYKEASLSWWKRRCRRGTCAWWIRHGTHGFEGIQHLSDDCSLTKQPACLVVPGSLLVDTYCTYFLVRQRWLRLETPCVIYVDKARAPSCRVFATSLLYWRSLS
jgi:hypothetical protein